MKRLNFWEFLGFFIYIGGMLYIIHLKEFNMWSALFFGFIITTYIWGLHKEISEIREEHKRTYKFLNNEQQYIGINLNKEIENMKKFQEAELIRLKERIANLEKQLKKSKKI